MSKKSFSAAKDNKMSEFEATFMIRPIGYLESVYREKFGTPR